MAVKSKPRTSRAAVKVVNNKSKKATSLFQNRFNALVVAGVFVVVGLSGIVWARAATTTSSLWSNSAVPKVITDSDTNSVELGMKFKSKYSGQVTGVRFYKGPQNTGTHTGSLWTPDGRKLASVTFKNETASGWQSASFVTPVDVSANTTYVVSYFAPKGRYSADTNYFKDARVSGPLTGLKNGAEGGNGVYAYSSKSAFPKQTYRSTNYWVDVVFSTSRFSPTPKPIAPSNLKATVSGTTVALQWTASTSTGVVKHEVIRNSQVVGPNVLDANYTDSGLTKGQSYSYQVRAVDGSGQTSDMSNTVSVTIPQDAPPAPAPNPTPTPTPDPTPPPVGSCTSGSNVAGSADPWGSCWPGPDNTGVPAGTVLSAYNGPCTITAANTVIDKKTINCDTLIVAAMGVRIQSSKMAGRIDVDGSNRSLTITDSEINGGRNTAPTIGFDNLTVLRSEITGAQHNILCGSNCDIRDNWMHGQVPQVANGYGTHNNAYISNGGSNVKLIHNTLSCDVTSIKGPNDEAGCSGDASFYGDFAPITNILVDKNLMAGDIGSTGISYCFYGGYDTKPYGPRASNITVTNNIFKRGVGGKCGYWGPVTNYLHENTRLAAPNSLWSNNKWEDGAVINP